MEMRNTIFSRRTVVSFALAGLVTASLPLTSESEPAPGETGAQPAIKVLTNPPAGAESQRLAGPPKPAPLPGLSKKISLDLRQMDILVVLKFLAEQGDFNIVPGKNVGGRVTLAVKDITIQDALDIIALTNELAYVVQSRVIHVMTEADYQRLFGGVFADQREVKTVYLQYADATAVATVLGNVKSAVGRIVADPQTRTIILIDVPEKVGQMVAAAEGMDRAAQLQTHAFELRYGKAADIKPEVEKALTPKLGAVRLDKRTNTLVVTDLAPQMQEIRRVISRFDRKTREAYVTSAVTQTTSASTTAEQVTFIDVGLQLKVLPTINEEGFVSMKIKPEVSSVSRSLTTAAGNSIPIVDTSSAETTVMVKDGTTLVIAGLMKDEKIGAEKKLPVLGDIPFLGALFRSRDDRRAKTELIFFLTPTIISGVESVGVTGTGTRKQEEKQEEKKEEKDGTKEE